MPTAEMIPYGNFESFAERSHKGSLLFDLFVFIIPCFIFLEINIGGRLFVSEALLIVCLPFLLYARGRLLFEVLPLTLVVLGLLWLIGQVITDLIRDTPFVDYSRGWSRIVVFLCNFVGIYLLLKTNGRRWLIFAAGLTAGLGIGYFYNPSPYAETYPWKFGYGMSVTFAIVLASHYGIFRKRVAPELMLAVGALLNFFFAYRSLGLICALGALFLWLHRRGWQSRRIARDGPRKLPVLSMLGGLTLIFAAVEIYGFAASVGFMGEIEQQKHIAQSAGSAGIILGGRNELMVSLQAIQDSPIVGHGSWAKNPHYADLLDYRLEQLGYEVFGIRETDQIPTHSYLFGAWVEAGFAGALIWLWVLWLTIRMFGTAYSSEEVPMPWVVFSGILLLWNVPFSPFGAEQRLIAAYQIALVMLFLQTKMRYNRAEFCATAS